MGEFGIIILVWSVILGVVVSFLAYAYYAEKKRAEQMKAAALQLGLACEPQLSTADQLHFETFKLAGQGGDRQVRNVIEADSGELRLVIFDYQYTVGSGKNKSTYNQQVILGESDGLNTPEFTLGPENFFHRLFEFAGYADIDFESDPPFSNAYLLQGPDEAAVREFFNARRRKGIQQLGAVSLEGRASQFVYYRPNHRWNPEDLKQVIGQGLDVYRILGEG